MGAEEGSPIADSPEEKATEESHVETPAVERRSLSSGKKALTAAEEGEYDRRIRKRKPVAAKNSKRVKLMEDAMKSAPAMCLADKEDDVLQSIPSTPEEAGTDEILPIEGLESASPPLVRDQGICGGHPSEVAPPPTKDEYGDPIYPTVPPPRSRALKKLVEELEELSDKKTRITILRKQHSQAYDNIKSVASDIRATEEAITQLEAELDQKKTQLAQYEDVRKGLELQSSQVYTDFCRTLHAAKRIRRDIVVAAPVEAELRREIKEQVRTAHQKKLSAFKSRPKSLKLMKPDV
ncbi:triadin-like [Asparagus officinalis]|uniref:triadin-like n=1 Tax=Asparagus officinalis TaxID=4686 RepID=UPI00098DFFB5|nr:triadin-like [Asparagus officinalis]